MNQQRKPPTDNPSLPSYECPEYLASLKRTILMGDVYAGDLNEVDRPERYLPRNTNEGDAYPARLIRTAFQNFLAPIINSYAGALSLVEYADVPNSILDYEQDIDLQGNSLSVFFDNADTVAMRDGLIYIMVDYCSDHPENREQELNTESRPYLRLIERSQIINYKLERNEIDRCTIVEYNETESAYGVNLEKVYRVVEGADWRVVRLVESKMLNDEWYEEIVIDDDGNPLQGQYLGIDGNPIEEPPIITYRITGSGCGDRPYFYDLAKLNIRLYQSQSDLWELLHKCNTPVPCFATAKSIVGKDGAISLGPHDAIMLGDGGNAFYLQPTSDSATSAQESIAEIQRSIDRYSLTSSISGHQSKARTATEIRMLFASIQKQLHRFAEAKESAITSVIETMGLYLGLDSDSVGSIEVAADISALLTDETSVIALYQAGLLSLESAVTRLSQLGYQSDAAAEIAILKATEADAQAKLVESLSQPTDYQSAG